MMDLSVQVSAVFIKRFCLWSLGVTFSLFSIIPAIFPVNMQLHPNPNPSVLVGLS